MFGTLIYIHRIDLRGDISDPNNDGQLPAICEISVTKWMEAFEANMSLPNNYSQKFIAEYGQFYPGYTLLNRKYVYSSEIG